MKGARNGQLADGENLMMKLTCPLTGSSPTRSGPVREKISDVIALQLVPGSSYFLSQIIIQNRGHKPVQ